MTTLHQGAEDYLELRRSLGFKLKNGLAGSFVNSSAGCEIGVKRGSRRGSRWNGPRSLNICRGPNGPPG
jgi:hypothetical protein